MKTYVVVVGHGCYEDRDVKTMYAGQSYDAAFVAAHDKDNFPSEWTYSTIEIWENGVKVSEKDIL